MPVNLLSGLPGASKTLNLLRMVEEECKGRPIYQYGVTGCKLPWEELTLDQLHTWWELPIGSVIVVDECQEVWPAGARQSPDSVSRLATHRKGGYDFYLVTQHPTRINADLRKFIGPHFHYERVFGQPVAKEIRFEQCQSDTSKVTERRKAQVTTRPFSKKYFDLYHSAEIHTIKPKVPKAVYMLGAALLLCAFLGYRLFGDIGVDQKTPVSPVDTEQQTPAMLPSFADYTDPPPQNEKEKTLTASQYAAQFVPRIADVPHSAPIYDSVTEVKTYPRPQCILRVSNNECHCYTQQATPLDISHDTCVDIVENGIFNPFIADHVEGVGAQAAPAAAPAPVHLANVESPSHVTRIGNTPIVARREINLEPRSERKPITASF